MNSSQLYLLFLKTVTKTLLWHLKHVNGEWRLKNGFHYPNLFIMQNLIDSVNNLYHWKSPLLLIGKAQQDKGKTSKMN